MTIKKGFTLIELLVVIAIIALLLSILIPSLRAAKEIASGSVCLSNQKNLSLAWTSYSEDNKSMLVGGSNYYSGSGGTPYRWVEYPLLKDTDNPETTPPAAAAQYSIVTRKNGIRAGRLFPYTQNEALYHCPGDKNFAKPEPAAVYRSYAIAGLMNGEDFENRETSSIYSAISTYRYAATAPSGSSKKLYVVLKSSEIKSPGNKYVFVEEDVVAKGQTVNDGGFVLLYNGAYSWWDWPAYFHNESSTVGFADGHSERHRWEDPRTIQLMKYGTDTTKGGISLTNASTNPTVNEDLVWMVRGYLPTPVN